MPQKESSLKFNPIPFGTQESISNLKDKVKSTVDKVSSKFAPVVDKITSDVKKIVSDVKGALVKVKSLPANSPESVEVKKVIDNNLIDPEKSKETIKTVVEEDETVANNPLNLANKYLGLDENNTEQQDTIKGFLNNAIPGYMKNKGEVTKDENAWCAAFVNSILKEGKFETLDYGKDKYNLIRAKQYENIGSKVQDINSAKPGDIVIVQSKKTKGYHVAFYSGKEGNRNLILGGNQNNIVSVKEIDMDSTNVVSIRRIKNIEDMKKINLAKINSTNVGGGSGSTR